MNATQEEPDGTLRNSAAENPSGGGSPSGADIHNLVDTPADVYTVGTGAELLHVPTKKRGTIVQADGNLQSVMTPSFDEMAKLGA